MHTITVVGLGPGSIEHLSLQAYQHIQNSQGKMIARTIQHPTLQALQEEGYTFSSYDNIYQEADDFEQVYQTIVDDLLHEAKKGPVTYLVPGSPMVAEKTVSILQTKAEIRLIASMSFLDALFVETKTDPNQGFIYVDAYQIQETPFDGSQIMVVSQVHHLQLATSCKLALMERYPEEHPIRILSHLGLEDQLDQTVCLHQLDHPGQHFDHLTSLLILPVQQKPRMDEKDLLSILAQLRGPEGCPWDRKQTHQSLADHAIEEATELKEAIQEGDVDHIIEELGDVLLQVGLHSQIGKENGYFDWLDVTDGICKKMIFRHPHVFAGKEVDEADLPQLWQALKEQEKKNKHKK